MNHLIARHLFHFKIMLLVDRIVNNIKKIKVMIFIKIKIIKCQEVVIRRIQIKNIGQKVIRIRFHP